jgi:hypothetical protein
MDSEESLSCRPSTDRRRITSATKVLEHICFPVCVDLDFDSNVGEESDMESTKYFSPKTSTGEWTRISINPVFENVVSPIRGNIDFHSKVIEGYDCCPCSQVRFTQNSTTCDSVWAKYRFRFQ